MEVVMEGWVSIHRKIMDWEWYKDENVFRVFIHLLLLANHEDNMWQGMIIKRGQTLTSYSHIAEALGSKTMTVKKVRSAMQKLKTTKNVAYQRAGNGLLVTIVNYEFYQSDEGRRADFRTN
jgi:hypothetical protein